MTSAGSRTRGARQCRIVSATKAGSVTTICIGRHGEVVEIKSVDPRGQTWEIDQPSYRVYFLDTDGHLVTEGARSYLCSSAAVLDFADGALTRIGDRFEIL